MEKYKEKIRGLFEDAQHVSQSDRCVKELLALYVKFHKTPRFQQFSTILQSFMHTLFAKDKNSPYTKRANEFIAKAFTEFSSYEDQLAENGEDKENLDDSMVGTQPYDCDLMMFEIAQYLESGYENVRVNTCRFFHQVLQDVNQIESDVIDQICENLTQLVSDKEKSVRSSAINTLSVCMVNETPIRRHKIYFAAKFDSEVFVRICAFGALSPVKENAEMFCRGAIDPSPSVQKAIWKRLSTDVELKIFKKSQISTMFRHAFNSKLSKMLLSTFLPKIISTLDGGLVSLIDYFDLRYDFQFLEELFMKFYASQTNVKVKNKDTKFHILVRDFQKEFLDEKLRVLKDIEFPAAFVCRTMILHCRFFDVVYHVASSAAQRTQDSDRTIEEDEEEKETLDLADLLLPSLEELAKVIDGFSKVIIKREKGDAEDEYRNQAVLKELIQMTTFFLVTENNRRIIASCFEKFFTNFEYFLRFENLVGPVLNAWIRYTKPEKSSRADYENLFDKLLEYCPIEQIADQSAEVDSEAEYDQVERLIFISSIISNFMGIMVEKSLIYNSEHIQRTIYSMLNMCSTVVHQRFYTNALRCISSQSLSSSTPHYWKDYGWLPIQILDPMNKIKNIQDTALKCIFDVAFAIDFEVFKKHFCEHLHDIFKPEEIGQVLLIEDDEDFDEDFNESLIFERYLKRFFTYAPKEKDEPEMERHQSFTYRIFKTTVIGLCQLAVQMKFFPTALMIEIISIYILNSHIDHELFEKLNIFLISYNDAYISSDAEVNMFVLCFEQIITKVLGSNTTSMMNFDDPEDTLRVFFYNFALGDPDTGKGDCRDVLAKEAVQMLSYDTDFAWKFAVTLLELIPLGKFDDDTLEFCFMKIKYFIDKVIPSQDSAPNKRRKKKNPTDSNEEKMSPALSAVRRHALKLLTRYENELDQRE